MDSKNIIIIGIWSFVIILIIGFFILGIELDFFGYIILLFLGFILSIIIEWAKPTIEKQDSLLSDEFKELKSKIDQLSEEINNLKK